MQICYASDPMDLIPRQPDDVDLEQKYPGLDAFLSDYARSGKMLKLPARDKVYERAKFLRAIQEAFELVGGVPRLAIWADQNYDEFMKIIGKTIPPLISQAGVGPTVPVKIVSAIPPTLLDGEWEEGEFEEK